MSISEDDEDLLYSERNTVTSSWRCKYEFNSLSFNIWLFILWTESVWLTERRGLLIFISSQIDQIMLSSDNGLYLLIVLWRSLTKVDSSSVKTTESLILAEVRGHLRGHRSCWSCGSACIWRLWRHNHELYTINSHLVNLKDLQHHISVSSYTLLCLYCLFIWLFLSVLKMNFCY